MLLVENNKVQVLRTRSDFLRLNSKGRRISPTRWVTLYYLPKTESDFCVGYTLSRKIGSAVTRNKLRRWGREFFRRARKENSKLGIEIHVYFRPQNLDFYKSLSHQEFDQSFQNGFEQILRKIDKKFV